LSGREFQPVFVDLPGFAQTALRKTDVCQGDRNTQRVGDVAGAFEPGPPFEPQRARLV